MEPTEEMVSALNESLRGDGWGLFREDVRRHLRVALGKNYWGKLAKAADRVVHEKYDADCRYVGPSVEALDELGAALKGDTLQGERMNEAEQCGVKFCRHCGAFPLNEWGFVVPRPL